MRKIRIQAEGVAATATLADNETADAVWEALPLTGHANRWGDEVYFATPVQVALAADAREVMEPGELGYWPPGSAFCIFWGPTPASQGDEPRAASPVNPFGQLDGNPAALDAVPGGAKIQIERA